MPVNHIVHRHHRSHDSQPGRPSRSWPAPSLAATPRIVGGQARTASQPAANPNDPTQPATHLGGPRLASLVVFLYLADFFERNPSARNFGEDGLGGGGPDVRSGVVVGVDVFLDGGDEVGHGVEDAA